MMWFSEEGLGGYEQRLGMFLSGASPTPRRETARLGQLHSTQLPLQSVEHYHGDTITTVMKRYFSAQNNKEPAPLSRWECVCEWAESESFHGSTTPTVGRVVTCPPTVESFRLISTKLNVCRVSILEPQSFIY